MSIPRPRRRIYLIQSAAAGLTALAGVKSVWALSPPLTPDTSGPVLEREATLTRYEFARDSVLGTSFDLAVDAVRPGDADKVELAVLTEIERLRAILSTYDPTSEISRVSLGAAIESPELAEVLAAYETWGARTGGALDSRLNQVTRLWREGGQTGHPPDPAALRAALNAPGALNIDALGKGYIIDRAVAVARRLSPAGLLNIGGDLRAWGDVTWVIGVSDPLNPADNAPPLTTFPLRDAAVATSGGYLRYTTIAGVNYSHLVDPRTLTPAACLASATIIAADCLTANALSTAGCLLEAARTFALAAQHGSPGQLIVNGNGQNFRAGLLADATSGSPSAAPSANAKSSSSTPAPAAAAGASASKSAWPDGFQASIKLNIGAASATAARPNGPGGPPGGAPGGPGGPGGFGGRGGPGGFGGRGGFGKRAYVAVWIEDSNHKLVRTLTVLGDNSRYVTELTSWYQAVGRPDLRSIRSITRPSRPNGQFNLVWDGYDDKGSPLPQGDYTIKVEFNREHGRHAMVSTLLTCDAQPHTAELAASAESDVSKIEYGPRPAAPTDTSFVPAAPTTRAPNAM